MRPTLSKQLEVKICEKENIKTLKSGYITIYTAFLLHLLKCIIYNNL